MRPIPCSLASLPRSANRGDPVSHHRKHWYNRGWYLLLGLAFACVVIILAGVLSIGLDHLRATHEPPAAIVVNPPIIHPPIIPQEELPKTTEPPVQFHNGMRRNQHHGMRLRHWLDSGRTHVRVHHVSHHMAKRHYHPHRVFGPKPEFHGAPCGTCVMSS